MECDKYVNETWEWRNRDVMERRQERDWPRNGQNGDGTRELPLEEDLDDTRRDRSGTIASTWRERDPRVRPWCRQEWAGYKIRSWQLQDGNVTWTGREEAVCHYPCFWWCWSMAASRSSLRGLPGNASPTPLSPLTPTARTPSSPPSVFSFSHLWCLPPLPSTRL